MVNKIRLYVNQPLGQAQTVPLTKEQSNYLFAVMRLDVGAHITLFNGRDGSWDARVERVHKKAGQLMCISCLEPLKMPPDVWLAFTPLRKERMAMVVEKAVELGVRRVLLVQTEHTNNGHKIRLEKLEAMMIEATEQCGANFVPELVPCVSFDAFMSGWPCERHLMFCDETREQRGALLSASKAPWGILIGPEGGFSTVERAALLGSRQTHAISLGPRILRAETAAIAALSLWQSQLGDWSAQ